jgi:hypothetical protein
MYLFDLIRKLDANKYTTWPPSNIHLKHSAVIQEVVPVYNYNWPSSAQLSTIILNVSPNLHAAAFLTVFLWYRLIKYGKDL